MGGVWHWVKLSTVKKDRAAMLQNPCKATGFHYDPHDCKSNSKCILQKGWLAKLEGYVESLAGIFQHICPANNGNLGN